MLTIEVDLGSGRPLYRQIAEQLRRLIARQELTEGQELPSVRELSSNIGINLNTVAKAYRILANEGLLALRHGSRARVRRGASAQAPETDQLENDLHDVVSRLVLHGATRTDVKAFFKNA